MRNLREIALAAALLVAAGAAAAQGPKPLEVIAFSGGGNWPVWIAQEKGLFAQNGIAVKLVFTPDSVTQIRGLMEGKYDFGTTAYDKLTVKIGSTTLATYSNANAASGYVNRTFDVSSYAGQTVTLSFSGTEDSSLQTSFVLDDVAVNAS